MYYLKKTPVYIMCIIFCINLLGEEIVIQNKNIQSHEIKNTTGMSFDTRDKVIFPFGDVFLGANILYTGNDVQYISNFIAGKKHGVEICFDKINVYFIAQYIENKLKNVILYPNGFYTVTFNVSNGMLNGEYSFNFEPHLYGNLNPTIYQESFDAKYLNKINTNPNFKIQGKGVFKNNIFFDGSFLSYKAEGSYRITQIIKYEKGKIINKEEFNIFKIIPYILKK